MSDPISHIFVSQEIEKAYEYIQDKYKEYRVCLFTKEKDDFLLEDAKSVIKEAYVAEDKIKILLLGAKGYRVETQNSLLKILEEPPVNIVFILVGPSKSIFLPTIRSRMPIKELKNKNILVSTKLNLKNLCEKDIYDFVKLNSRISKVELKETIQSIISEAILNYNVSFTSNELRHFQNILELAQLNSRPQNLLFSLLVSIMQRERK